MRKHIITKHEDNKCTVCHCNFKSAMNLLNQVAEEHDNMKKLEKGTTKEDIYEKVKPESCFSIRDNNSSCSKLGYD